MITVEAINEDLYEHATDVEHESSKFRAEESHGGCFVGTDTKYERAQSELQKNDVTEGVVQRISKSENPMDLAMIIIKKLPTRFDKEKMGKKRFFDLLKYLNVMPYAF